MTSPIRIGSGSIILVPDARLFRKRASDDLKAIALSKNVLLTPQLPREFRKEAQTKIDAIHITGKVHLTPVLSDTFRADVRTKIDAALSAMRASVTINAHVDTARATAQMESWRSRQQRPLRIRVVTVHESSPHAGGGAGDLLPGMGGAVDATEVARALQKLNRELDRQGGVKVKTTPQLSNRAGAQMQRDMDRMANSLRLDPRIGGVNLRLPLGGAFGLTMLPEMISQLGGLTAAIQEVAQAGLILPGVFAAAGASFATVMVGISGLKEAYKALDTVQKDSVTTGASQQASQREMRNAVQDETHARRELADAITNEQRRQRDLSLQLRGGKLAEAGAILEIQEAAEKLRTGRFSNRMEYDQGLLDYEDKIQNLLEVRNHNADLAQDVAKNEKSGVANSDSVLNATDALTKATERIADASQKMADGSGAMTSATAKAQAALDKLAPSAAEFIKNMIAMRPEFHAFAQGVQEDLMSGLTPAFNNMFHSPAIQNNMRGGMQGLAAAMNAQLKTMMAQISTPQMGSIFDRIFGSTTDSAKRFNGSGLPQMIDGFMKLGAVGAEELPRLSDALGVMLTRFDSFVNKADKDGSLKHWMDQGLDAFTQIGRIVQNIFSAMSGVNKVFGGSFLKDVDDVTKHIADFLNSGRGQSDLEKLVVNTKAAMAEWKPILMDLIPILKTAFDTGRTYVSSMLAPLDILLKVLGRIPGGVETVLTAFLTWKTISGIVTPIIGALRGMEGYLGNVHEKLQRSSGVLGGVGKAADGLSGKIGNLANTFAMGSPLAIALGTITTIAFDQYLKKQQAVEEETRQLIQRQNEFADSLDRTTGLITQQTRDEAAKRLSDFAPTHKGSLTGNPLLEAKKLGIGGDRGADLVTATLPGGEGQYKNIMGQLRDKVRPLVREDADLLEMAKANGLSEDDVLDAFLGIPSARAKYDNAFTHPHKNANLPSPDNPNANIDQLPGLDTLQRQAQSQGGDVLGAAIVGQALSDQRQSAQGGAPGSPAEMARLAANPNVGLPDRSPFGDGIPSAGNGEFKIVSKVSPTDPNMKAILAAGATVEATVPGTVGPDGNPLTGWVYTLNHELASKYMTGVPQYHTGGPTKAGLGNMLDDEFVIRDRGRFPAGTLDAINDGKINPDDLPHLFPGGPVPMAPPIPIPPPVPPPVVPDVPVVEHPPVGAPPVPGPPDVVGAAPTPAPASNGPLDFTSNPMPGIPDLPALAGQPAPPGLLAGPPIDLAGAAIPGIPPAGLNGLIFGAQGAPSGGFGAPGGQGGFGQSFLSNIMGGGAGGKGIEGMLGADAAKFGGILMQGLLGFFGINPEYMQDIFKLIPGLAKVAGGTGYGSPDAMNSVESQIVSYDSSGTPIYYAPGSPGTALPAANSTGTAGMASVGQTPGGLYVGTNSATRAAIPLGGTTTSAVARAGLSPLYKPGTSFGYGSRPDASAGVPDSIFQLAEQFGLEPSTDPHGSLHSAGFAFDFAAAAGNKDPAGSMDAFSQFIQDHLMGQTLELIHQQGSAQGQGQHWGIAGGQVVDQPGAKYQNYFTDETNPGEGYSAHSDTGKGPHVHWATDVAPILSSTPFDGSAATGVPNTSTSPSPPSTTNAFGPGPSAGPQVTNPNSAGTSSGGSLTPLPDSITAQINGQLPPAQLSPPTSGSAASGESDADQVLALDSKGNLTVESRGVAKARGDIIMGPAPKDDETGIGKSGAAGSKPPSNMVNSGAGLDINPTDLQPGGGGTGLFNKGMLWSPKSGIIGGAGSLPSQLDAAAGTSAGGADIKARARAMYLQAGLPANEWPAFDALISHESGWRPTAQNPGSTAHGLGQFLNTTWATVGMSKTDDADAQLQGIFQYLKQRPDYRGSPAAAWNLWQQRHWYDKGGVVDDLKGVGAMGASFLDDAGLMALSAFTKTGGAGMAALSVGAKGLGIFGPEIMDAISPQARTSDSDVLDYTKLAHHAMGNLVTGGSGHKDDVLAMLMGGEYVHRTATVKKYGVDFHHALNTGMIDPKAVDALMSGAISRHALGFIPGAAPPSSSDLQAIQQQLAGSPTAATMNPSSAMPAPPVPPSRSGVDMSQIPNVNKMMPPQSTRLQPTTTMPSPQAPPQPGGPTAPPAPAPLEPEAGVPVQPDIAPAPKSTDHELPALKTGITSTASTLGSLAATAASMSGFGAPAASVVSGAFQQAGKIANSIANVVSSALVGTITPGTTANPYGQRIKGNQAPNTLMPIDNSTHYHGDLYANDMDDFMRRQDIRDSVNYQSQMAAAPGL